MIVLVYECDCERVIVRIRASDVCRCILQTVFLSVSCFGFCFISVFFYFIFGVCFFVFLFERDEWEYEAKIPFDDFSIAF